jgi:hypothetical protein
MQNANAVEKEKSLIAGQLPLGRSARKKCPMTSESSDHQMEEIAANSRAEP